MSVAKTTLVVVAEMPALQRRRTMCTNTEGRKIQDVIVYSMASDCALKLTVQIFLSQVIKNILIQLQVPFIALQLNS
jgi:hypothetical protein